MPQGHGAVATIGALFLLGTVAAGQAGTAEAKPSSPADVAHFTLDNGLEVVVVPDRRAPVVTHMVWYRAGSADEPAGRSGIAHFLEHLMFKGTRDHPAGAFTAEIAAIGGRENAFTSYDYTAYFQQVEPAALETMMRFEADRMANLVLDEAVIGPERDVVIEERNQRIDNNPQGILGEGVEATLYVNHPYGVPIIGWMHEIETLGRDDALAFYERFYAPNNAVLVVTGDVDADAVRAMAERTYGVLPAKADIGPRQRPAEPPPRTQRTVSFADPRVSVPSLRRAWLVPSYATAEPGQAEALDLLAEILGGGVRSRIYQELVVRRGIASAAGAYYRGSALDHSSFAVYGSPRGDAELADVEAALQAEIAKIAEEGVTADEVERARRRFLRSLVFARDDQSGMARLYGAALTTGSTVADVEAWPERLRAVTPDAVQDAARRHLSVAGSVTGYLLPPDEGANP